MIKDCHKTIIFTLIAIICVMFLMAGDAYLKYYTPQVDELVDKYEAARESLINHEYSRQLGSKLQLTLPEIVVNQRIFDYKVTDLSTIFDNITGFVYGREQNEIQAEIQKRPLYQMLRSMPKGAALNVHDITMCDIDHIVNIMSYHRKFWLCVDKQNDFVAARFSLNEPQNETDVECQWSVANDLRTLYGKKLIDVKLTKRLTLAAYEPFKSLDDAIKILNGIHKFIYGFLTFKSAWIECYWQAMYNHLQDGVQYLELRTSLPELYTLNAENYTKIDNLYLIMILTNRFKVTHPSFIGTKIIYARNAYNFDGAFNFNSFFREARLLQNAFNALIPGFDIVNLEENFKLKDYAHKLLSLENDEHFYLHAGQTNWLKRETDQNLMDAVLMGVKRIGHGFTILKHPETLRLIKNQNIPIEVNPVERRMPLNLFDYRNHPDSILFSTGFPILITADDSIPMNPLDTPMTLDFYMAVVAIAPENADLATLKMLAINSIRYSGMNCEEKSIAFEIWTKKWDTWINKMQGTNQSKEVV